MVEQALLDYIRTARADNEDDTSIRSSLLNRGWLPVQIGEAFDSLAFSLLNHVTSQPIESAITEPTFWDPIEPQSNSPTTITVKEEVLENRDRSTFNFYRRNPSLIRLIFGLLVFFSLFVIVLVLHIIPELVSLAFFTVIPPILFYTHVSNIAQRLVMDQIAEQMGWRYVSIIDVKKFEALRSAFPRIFNIQNKLLGVSYRLEKQLWGKISILENVERAFWLAQFTYEIGTGRGSTTINESVIALPLAHPCLVDFFLRPREEVVIGLNEQRDSIIQTESSDFNRQFMIEYDGEKNTVGPAIFEVLNPAVLEKLLQLRAEQGQCSVLFKEKMILISFTRLITPSYTNFLIKPGIDPRDVSEIEQRLKDIINLVNTGIRPLAEQAD